MSGRPDSVRGNDAAAPFAGFPDTGTVVIFDLEITAWEGSLARNWTGPGEFKEVVQIGAVRVDAAMPMEERDSFEVLIRPEKNPVLSDYFVHLTGITNADIDRVGMTFADALHGFAEFSSGAGMIVSNGGDCSSLELNAEWCGLDWPFPAGLFRDIKSRFAELLSVARSDAVSSDLPRLLGLQEMPDAHTGLGDSRAIAAAMRHLRATGRF
ncbi:exonuclease domain-containing protein [Nisaea acidiphila]|uniref:Exonuclease domain-containing protein n=1 Tax=Nisaea acidiphila TaxID=1862145 RepID=A0A9J7APQ0_9PROT|nr:3'-5' exonuclease [Nisaea acidiphila]UUX49191.1 exonuclease domain-containing protein [Nisaea acidiphila]